MNKDSINQQEIVLNGLGKRHKQVAVMLAEGIGPSVIAHKLQTTRGAIKNVVANLGDALGVSGHVKIALLVKRMNITQ